MPGQFKHLAPQLARDPANKVVFVTKRDNVDLPGVRRISYPAPRAAKSSTHHYVRLFENSVLHGQQVVRVCQDLAREGFRPDVMVAHPGWGEALFLKDAFPRAPLLNFCEFFYHGRGADVGFDPDETAGIDEICRARARNAHLLMSLESCDAGLSPTHWQKSRHPAEHRDKISVIFDGIDTQFVRPDPAATFTLPDGRVLSRSDEVVTYVARNLEPYRGFPTFMRSLPRLLRMRPRAQVLIVGGDEVSYGRAAPDGKPGARSCWPKSRSIPNASTSSASCLMPATCRSSDFLRARLSDAAVRTVLVVRGSHGGRVPRHRLSHRAGAGSDRAPGQRPPDRFPRS
jgi:glycosyltransferase involved in cell wall biosynthesis